MWESSSHCEMETIEERLSIVEVEIEVVAETCLRAHILKEAEKKMNWTISWSSIFINALSSILAWFLSSQWVI
jgi:hypothetical protein